MGATDRLPTPALDRVPLLPGAHPHARDRAPGPASEVTRELAWEFSREFTFDASDFDRIRCLIRDRAGISLTEQKQNLAYSRLARRLRAHGMRSFSDYLDRLERDTRFRALEEQEFVNALTTNLTAFFREAHHFSVLEDFLRDACGGTPRLWCAAASTGEEAYSIAMVMAEAAGSGSPGSVLATDIDTQVIATAQRGVYRSEDAQVCGTARLKRFFLRGKGANAGMVRVRPELAALVRFARLNLLDETWPLARSFAPQMDAVFCRNVMIYFDRPTQDAILARLAQILRPGGLLFAGHSESFTDRHPALRLLGRTVYQRI
jgi:chemotaxis protein methyltransferase CheR